MNLSREIVGEKKLQGYRCSNCHWAIIRPWLRKLMYFEDTIRAAYTLSDLDVFELTHEVCPKCSHWMDEDTIKIILTESRGDMWAKTHGSDFTVTRSSKDEFNRFHEEWLAEPEQQAKLKSGEAIIDHTRFAHMDDLVNVVEDDLTSPNRKIAPVSVPKSK